MNQGVAAVKANGEYEKIYERWIRPDRSAALARRISWALGVASLVLLLFALWTVLLRRQVGRQTAAFRREYEEKQRVQTELANRERDLHQARKLEVVGRLTGGIAHDFNNILTAVVSNAALLREDLIRTRQATTEVDGILSAAERATRLTRQLLAFSRASPLCVGPLNLAQVVPEMRSLLRTLVGAAVQLELAVPDTPLFVAADLTQIEQILLNLAANARDAMPSGGQLSVTIARLPLATPNEHGLAAGEYAALVVADTGVGMDEPTLARIFDPFFTTKEVGKGTGLGLATVATQISQLGGRITVQSQPGRGTTFTIILRCCAPPSAESRPGAWPSPLPSSPG